MNNKVLGTTFEKEFCKLLKDKGYWVHFIEPNKAGGQPFDIIACKSGYAYAFDCKTASNPIFRISRLEDNQIMAFDKWMRCKNNTPQIAVKYNDEIMLINYGLLKAKGKVDLREMRRFEMY